MVRAFLVSSLAAILVAQPAQGQNRNGSIRHLIFFGNERARITDTAFINNPNIAGAQLKYSWRELEPARDRYHFQPLLDDIAILEKHGKKLWIQLQDVSFSDNQIVPDYLLNDAEFNGGAVRKYEDGHIGGWVARRWDPAVRERLSKLLHALGAAVDGRIEGINFAETAIGFNEPAHHPRGFTFQNYAEGIQAMMTAARSAFPRSHVVIYANFMPGEGLPHNDRGYLRGVYDHAQRIGAGVGGPDLLPARPWQQRHSLPLIAARGTNVVAALAVQDGNLAESTVTELVRYATDRLRLDYMFWGTEEPYYSQQVLPYLRSLGQ